MSSTKRGSVRSEADYYPTRPWCVHRLLDRVALPGGDWLEPAAGDGAIIRAVNRWRKSPHWTAMEIRPECRSQLQEIVPEEDVLIGDFVKEPPAGHWDVSLTNPPFWIALPFIKAALPLADWCAFLLRLNFIGTVKRRGFFANEMPDVYVLPNRPPFRLDGKTDSIEYAWFVWTPERGRKAGRIEILDETSPEERRLVLPS